MRVNQPLKKSKKEVGADGSSSRLITPVLIGGCIIIMTSFAIRATFGVFQIPIASEFGWPRSDFSLAIAIQNLAWGIGQPIFGAIAEKFGDRKAIAIGAACYVLGLVFSSFATQAIEHQIWEIFIGFGIAGMGFGVILAVVGRAASPENRSLALGITTAAGSLGQIVGPPLASYLLTKMSWQSEFLVFAAIIVISLAALPTIKATSAPQNMQASEPMGVVLNRAFRDPSYILIFVGFFSCGYQLAFITAHFPAFITEMCGAIDPNSLFAAVGIASTSTLGAVAIALIGVTNIAGTVAAGWMGSRYPKKYLLAAIYTGRTLVAATFILLPITPTSVVIFSLSMGALWLATVPLTSGLVASLYGTRFMGTLYGFVFFSHQLGGFMGVWLGGKMYDTYGDYTLVWWIGVGVGAFSAIVHLPVREQRQFAPAE